MATTQALDLQATGERIETLLDILKAGSDPRSYGRAAEVLKLVSDLYGAALGRVVDLASRESPSLMNALIHDELVAGLLMVHDLHPESLRTRVETALRSVRPLLSHHGGGVELIDIDEEVGAVFLRLLGSCDGCPSSTVTLQNAVERAIVEAAPEISIIDIEQQDGADGIPITLSRKQTFESCPTVLTST
ncbi:MAG: hypothetical protein NVS3B21_17100 [Acidimicrobiales bacterium]